MKFGTWLLALVPSLTAKILLALGFAVVTITGVQVALQQLKDTFIGQINSLPADALQLFLLGGGGVGLGIVFGAAATCISIWAIQGATKILGVSS